MTAVSVALVSPDGAPLVGAKVSATPTTTDMEPSRLVMRQRVSLVTDAAGAGILVLHPNSGGNEAYQIVIKHPLIVTYIVTVVVPDIAAITLFELLGGVQSSAPIGAIVFSRGYLVADRGPIVFA